MYEQGELFSANYSTSMDFEQGHDGLESPFRLSLALLDISRKCHNSLIASDITC